MAGRNFEFRSMNRRPITSYGVLLFTVVSSDGKNEIRYQIQKRRDSISFQEFIKDSLPFDEIRMHIGMMSKEERKRCIDYYLKDDARSLWDDLWINHKSRIYKNDMERCCKAFKRNMEKYIDLFLDDRKGASENSWGFPKGRKQSNETEKDCAFREFEEETTISREVVQDLKIPPYEELYTGSDGNPYRTVLYVAYIPYIPDIHVKSTPGNIRTSYISEEVSEIAWCTYSECLQKLDLHKRNILKNLNRTLLFSRKRKPPQRRFTY
jgi:8-oxo-dGTP pyrophosphatase MutT (NUDIX family)